MPPIPSIPEPLLTADEVAGILRVDPRTVLRWAQVGHLKSIMTPGGRLRRFRSSDVEALLVQPDQPQNESEPARCSNT